jgi:hypothetical protein
MTAEASLGTLSRNSQSPSAARSLDLTESSGTLRMEKPAVSAKARTCSPTKPWLEVHPNE